MSAQETGEKPKERHNCDNHAVMQLIVQTMDRNLQKISEKMDILLEQQMQSGKLCLLREHEMKTLKELIVAQRGDHIALTQLHESDKKEIWDEIDSLRNEDRDQGKHIAEMRGASGMARWLIPIGIGLLSSGVGAAVAIMTMTAKVKGAS